MAVTGQDLPGLRKPNADVRRREAALSRLWGAVRGEAGKAIAAVQRLLSVTVFSSLTGRIIFLNLIVDIVYAFLDPRVRY
jgi:hypothetical protein